MMDKNLESRLLVLEEKLDRIDEKLSMLTKHVQLQA